MHLLTSVVCPMLNIQHAQGEKLCVRIDILDRYILKITVKKKF